MTAQRRRGKKRTGRSSSVIDEGLGRCLGWLDAILAISKRKRIEEMGLFLVVVLLGESGHDAQAGRWWRPSWIRGTSESAHQWPPRWAALDVRTGGLNDKEKGRVFALPRPQACATSDNTRNGPARADVRHGSREDVQEESDLGRLRGEFHTAIGFNALCPTRTGEQRP